MLLLKTLHKPLKQSGSGEGGVFQQEESKFFRSCHDVHSIAMAVVGKKRSGKAERSAGSAVESQGGSQVANREADEAARDGYALAGEEAAPGQAAPPHERGNGDGQGSSAGKRDYRSSH